jgi:acyl carrier protein
MAEVRNAICEIFVSEVGLEPEDFTDELTYKSVPEWDSQGHMLLVFAIEEKFGISLESDEIVTMTSLPKILDVLRSRGKFD